MAGFKPSGKGGGGGGNGKLSGGHWVTIHGHPAYIKGGKVVAGGVPGLTHGKDGTPHGAAQHGAHQPIPMRPKKGGVTDSSKAVGKVQAPAKDARQARADKHVADTARDVHEARKALDRAKAKGAAPSGKAAPLGKHLEGLHAKKAELDARHAGHKAALAGHDAKIAELRAKLEAHKAGPGPGPTAPAHPVTKVTPGKSGMVGKPNPANQARAQAASKSAQPHDKHDPAEGVHHTVDSYARKHGVGLTAARAHLDRLHGSGHVTHERADDTYHVPKGTAGPKSAGGAQLSVKTSAPRTAREAAVHADAKARGKSAMVVTSTPQYRAEKSGGTTHHTVGGRTVASQHVDAAGRHVVMVHHANGSHTVYRHGDADSARKHVTLLARDAIAKGTTRHAVVGDDLARFDHAAHGIGGAGHRVTARILGDGRARVAVRSARRGPIDGSKFRPRA